MAGLFMKLAPHERFFVNGALIANGDKRGTINILQRDAVVIRESALLTPETAETDLARLILSAQNALLGLGDHVRAMEVVRLALPAVHPGADGPMAVHLREARTAHAQGDLRGVYIALERALRIEAQTRKA